MGPLGSLDRAMHVQSADLRARGKSMQKLNQTAMRLDYPMAVE
jgi:hypothetical protein